LFTRYIEVVPRAGTWIEIRNTVGSR